jgi:hypothetical protein
LSGQLFHSLFDETAKLFGRDDLFGNSLGEQFSLPNHPVRFHKHIADLTCSLAHVM